MFDLPVSPGLGSSPAIASIDTRLMAKELEVTDEDDRCCCDHDAIASDAGRLELQVRKSRSAKSTGVRDQAEQLASSRRLTRASSLGMRQSDAEGIRRGKVECFILVRSEPARAGYGGMTVPFWAKATSHTSL